MTNNPQDINSVLNTIKDELMTDDSQAIDSLYDSVFSTIKKALMDNKGDDIPQRTLFVLPRNSKLVKAAVVPSDISKDELAETHIATGSDPSNVCAILVLETWMVSGSATDADKLTKLKTLADHPERKTAYVFSIMTPLRQGMAYCIVTDDPNDFTQGKINWLDESPEGMKYAGRFIRKQSDDTTKH